MIVEEKTASGVNVFVDGYVFYSDDSGSPWVFGDGNASAERIAAEASKRAMTPDAFMARYSAVCDAAAGRQNPDWTYSYRVVALDAKSTEMVKEMMERVEEAFERNNAFQDKAKCEELLKRTISIGMVRMNGLCVKKYITDAANPGVSRIVYDMKELPESYVSALIPAGVLESRVYRS